MNHIDDLLIKNMMGDIKLNINSIVEEYACYVNSYDREDITAEVVLYILELLDKGIYDSKKASLRTYLNVVMRNKIHDYLRKLIRNEKRMGLYLDAVSSDDLYTIFGDRMQTLGICYRDNYDELDIGDIKKGLSCEEAKVVDYLVAGNNFAQIAELLNVSKARVSKIKKNIENKLKKYYRD